MKAKFICSVGILASALFTLSSHAQTVEEYTAASNNSGCIAIPYANFREKCQTHQSDVKLWCDGKGSRICDERHFSSDSFLEKIRNLDTAIKDRTAQNKTDEVRDLQNQKKTAENEITSAGKEVERRLELTQQCIKHRGLVQKFLTPQSGGSRASAAIQRKRRSIRAWIKLNQHSRAGKAVTPMRSAKRKEWRVFASGNFKSVQLFNNVNPSIGGYFKPFWSEMSASKGILCAL